MLGPYPGPVDGQRCRQKQSHQRRGDEDRDLAFDRHLGEGAAVHPRRDNNHSQLDAGRQERILPERKPESGSISEISRKDGKVGPVDEQIEQPVAEGHCAEDQAASASPEPPAPTGTMVSIPARYKGTKTKAVLPVPEP